MPVAVGLLTLGFILIVSAVKGVSIVQVFRGELGDPLDPKGGKADIGGAATALTAPSDNQGTLSNLKVTGASGSFKGPNAARLEALRKVAVSKYDLKVTQICRPANATYGSPTSLHKQCRAMDLSGKVSDMVAFARYAKTLDWVDEVYCDQAGMVAPGYDHSDHVHVGA